MKVLQIGVSKESTFDSWTFEPEKGLSFEVSSGTFAIVRSDDLFEFFNVAMAMKESMSEHPDSQEEGSEFFNHIEAFKKAFYNVFIGTESPWNKQ